MCSQSFYAVAICLCFVAIGFVILSHLLFAIIIVACPFLEAVMIVQWLSVVVVYSCIS